MALLILIGFIIIWGAIWATPLYLCVNFVLFLFHISFHVTLLQAFGVCLLLSAISELLFKNDKNQGGE